MIDIIDCSGSGDVAMGAPVCPESVTIDGRTRISILGISGRVLNLNSDWKNPTGKFRLGIKVTVEKRLSAVRYQSSSSLRVGKPYSHVGELLSFSDL